MLAAKHSRGMESERSLFLLDFLLDRDSALLGWWRAIGYLGPMQLVQGRHFDRKTLISATDESKEKIGITLCLSTDS